MTNSPRRNHRGRGGPRRPVRPPEPPAREPEPAAPLPLRVEERRTLRVPADKVFPLLARFESLPRFSRLWTTSDVLERRQQQATIVLRGYFCGLPVETTVRVQVRPPRVEFAQRHGSFRDLRGWLVASPAEDGSTLTYVLEADPAIAMIDERAARLALTQDVQTTLDKVKSAAERTLREREVRRIKTRQRAKAAAAAADARDENAEPEPEVAASSPAPEPAETPPHPAPTPEPASPPRRRRRRRQHRPRPVP